MGESAETAYAAEREKLAKGLFGPAFAVVAKGYKGHRSKEIRELEEDLLDRVEELWREAYLTHRGQLVRHHRRASDLVGFLVYYARPLLAPRGQVAAASGLTDAEIDSLLARLRRDLSFKLAEGRAVRDEAKLAALQVESQRRALADLLHDYAERDVQDAMPRLFLRARDLEPLRHLYAVGAGQGRPLMTALSADDWDELLKLWLRGWRPALEAFKIRLAARIDGVPRGGALDLVTTY